MSRTFISRSKYLIWRVLNRVGIDVYPADFRNSIQSYLKYILDSRDIAQVIDIGANEGQYGLMLRNLGFTGKITSYEPLPDAWQVLKDNSKKDILWDIADRSAVVSNENVSEVQIFQTDNSVSSSMLEPLKSVEYAVDRMVTAPSIGINSVLRASAPGSLLKLDVQGYEMSLIEGIDFSFSGCPEVLQLELAIKATYKDEILYTTVVDFLKGKGYQLIYVFPGVANGDGQLLQIECIFEKTQ